LPWGILRFKVGSSDFSGLAECNTVEFDFSAVVIFGSPLRFFEGEGVAFGP